jgi:hypothetical protein
MKTKESYQYSYNIAIMLYLVISKPSLSPCPDPVSSIHNIHHHTNTHIPHRKWFQTHGKKRENNDRCYGLPDAMGMLFIKGRMGEEKDCDS